MGKSKQPILKNIIVLTMITIVAGLCLALTYNFTKPAIDEAERQNVLKSIKEVFPKDKDGSPVYKNAPDNMKFDFPVDEKNPEGRKIEFYPGLDANGEIIGFAIMNISPVGYGGDISFMIGVDKDGKIHDIYILAIAETPGLGTKIDEPKFKGQFLSKSMSTGDKIELTKDPKNTDCIVAISGATISSRAMTNCVNEAVKYYLDHKEIIAAKVKEHGNSEGGQQ